MASATTSAHTPAITPATAITVMTEIAA